MDHGRLTVDYYKRPGVHRKVTYELRTPSGSAGAQEGESFEEAVAAAQAGLRNPSFKYEARAIFYNRGKWWDTALYGRELGQNADGTWHAARGADLVKLRIGDPNRRTGHLPMSLTHTPPAEQGAMQLAAIVTAAGTIRVNSEPKHDEIPDMPVSWVWASAQHGELSVKYDGPKRDNTVVYRLTTPLAREATELSAKNLQDAFAEAQKIAHTAPYHTAQAIYENEGTYYSTDAYVRLQGPGDFYGRAGRGETKAARIGRASDPKILSASSKFGTGGTDYGPVGFVTEQGGFPIAP
jgi:hypothetical protein